jgi:hypothetical protein
LFTLDVRSVSRNNLQLSQFQTGPTRITSELPVNQPQPITFASSSVGGCPSATKVDGGESRSRRNRARPLNNSCTLNFYCEKSLELGLRLEEHYMAKNSAVKITRRSFAGICLGGAVSGSAELKSIGQIGGTRPLTVRLERPRLTRIQSGVGARACAPLTLLGLRQAYHCLRQRATRRLI